MFWITFTEEDFVYLKSSLFTNDGKENACFAICGYAKTENTIRLFPRKILPVPKGSYKIQTSLHLEIEPSFINHVIDEAESKFAILVIHSHPGNLSSNYSGSDDFGELRLFEVFSDLLPDIPHASLLFSESSIIGRYFTDGRFVQVDKMSVVGRQISFPLIKPSMQQTEKKRYKKLYDRQILAFGKDFQDLLRHIRVGIVGVGGTGSLVAEEIVRMGITNLSLVDFDTFEMSNLTRMYGSTQKDIRNKKPKVKIVSGHLKRINRNLKIKEIVGSVVYQETLIALRDLDIIFSCTDNDWSRSVLNRFSYQYLTPIIDMGLRIVIKEGLIKGAGGRVSIIGPGFPCLWTSHHLNAERIRTESMDSKERTKLEKEKYIEGYQTNAPSVISLNSALSSFAVTLFMAVFTGFSNLPRTASEQMYDAIAGEVFTSTPLEDPFCPICGDNGLKSLGDTQVVSAWSKQGDPGE